MAGWMAGDSVHGLLACTAFFHRLHQTKASTADGSRSQRVRRRSVFDARWFDALAQALRTFCCVCALRVPAAEEG